MKSLKKEIFERTLVITILMITIFGFLSAFFFYKNQKDTIYKFIKIENSDVSNYIRAFFIKIYIEVEYLSKLKEVRFAFLLEKYQKKALKAFKTFQLIDRDINYVYAGYKNGMLVINDYIPPKGFNPVVRPWYKYALKSFPNVSDGIPYKEIKTKEWLVSISKALIDNKGNIVGVGSIDTSIDKIIKKMNEINFFKLSNLIIRKDGVIIIANNKFVLNKNFVREFNLDKNLFNKREGFFEYEDNNRDMIAHFIRLDRLGWIIISSIDKNLVLKLFLEKLVLIFLIVSFLSVIFGFLYANVIYRKIIYSLKILQKNLKDVIDLKDSPDTLNTPFVEFDLIYKNLRNLTHNALYKKNKELDNLNKKLFQMAIKDSLTGLFNRYKFNESLSNEIKNFTRYKQPFCLIMFDIDFFKKINDTYGHDVGDKVLKGISKIATSIIRETDIVARWGGEEFIILCPHTDLKEGIEIAERLRKRIENYDFGIRRVTISVGVAEYNNETEKDFIKKVDDNLYKAKKSGRNRVVY